MREDSSLTLPVPMYIFCVLRNVMVVNLFNHYHCMHRLLLLLVPCTLSSMLTAALVLSTFVSNV